MVMILAHSGKISSRQLLCELFVAVTTGNMIIDHAHGLHMGIKDNASEEFKSALFEVEAQDIGCGS